MKTKLPPSLFRLSWIFQLITAGILLQTLFFKFSGAPESIYIFETVGLEPLGRYGSGIVEGIAGILLLVPGLAWLGAALAVGVISGAIFFHLTTLGIVVLDDGGTLFIMALIVIAFSLGILAIRRREIPFFGRKGLSIPKLAREV